MQNIVRTTRRTSHRRFLLSAMAIGLALGGLMAASSAAMAASSLSHGDASFLKAAARAGHTEIMGSQTALTKSSDAQVKTFAQQMIDDHTKTGNDLSTLASSKGLTLPAEPSVTQKAKLKMVSEFNGANYDYHYAETIGVSAHEDAVKLFRKAASDAKDADVKAFASNTLPALEHHLQMAKDLEAAAATKAGKKP